MKFPRMNTIRRATSDDDPDDILEFSLDQTQERLSKQLQNDKQRTVVKNLAEIKRAKGMLERAQDPHLRKQLRQRIKTLTVENNETQRYS